MSPRTDVLQGTLDLLVLKTLDTLGAMHGYGLAQRIRQVSDGTLSLNQGRFTPPWSGWRIGDGFGRSGRPPSTTDAQSSTH